MAFVLLAMLLATFSIPPQRAHASGDTATIVIQGASAPPGFSPSFLTIHVYDTVIFINRSSPPVGYAVSASDGSFSAPAIAPNQQWKVTFNSVGAHEFHATSAPQRMAGEILVVDNAVSLLPTSVPSVDATVGALIQSGHVPPDNLLVATPASNSLAKQAVKKTSSRPPPLAIFIALACLGAFFSALVYLLLRLRKYLAGRKRPVSEEEDQEDTVLTETAVPMRMGKEKRRIPGPAVHVPNPGNAPLLRLRRVQVKDEDEDE